MRYVARMGWSTISLALLAAWPVHADDHPMLDYVSVSVGAFANNTSATLRADGDVRNSGTRLDFSRDLGQGGTRTLPYIDVTWRPWERHEFEFSYYYDSNDNSRTLSRTIIFNQHALMLGAQLSSRFTLNAGSLSYRYWAWIGDNAAFGLTAGLQAYHFSLRLSSTETATSIGGSASSSSTANSRASSSLPNPSIGLSYRYQMADWARLVADGGAFKANIDQIDATLYNARLGVEFFPWKHFGVVTQYSYNKIDADINRSRFHGNTDFEFKGFQVLLQGRF